MYAIYLFIVASFFSHLQLESKWLLFCTFKKYFFDTFKVENGTNYISLVSRLFLLDMNEIKWGEIGI